MEATFNLQIAALNAELIAKLKSLFSQNAKIEIRVTDADTDETSYLLSSEKNRETLQRSINQLNNSELITKTLNELQ